MDTGSPPPTRRRLAWWQFLIIGGTAIAAPAGLVLGATFSRPVTSAGLTPPTSQPASKVAPIGTSSPSPLARPPSTGTQTPHPVTTVTKVKWLRNSDQVPATATEQSDQVLASEPDTAQMLGGESDTEPETATTQEPPSPVCLGPSILDDWWPVDQDPEATEWTCQGNPDPALKSDPAKP
jgi:hypothetical protein